MAALLAKLRLILNDSSTGGRWTDAQLTAYLQEAVYEFFRLRREFLLADDGSLNAVDVSFVPAQHLGRLADYAAYRALFEDDSDRANAEKADAFLKSFREGMAG